MKKFIKGFTILETLITISVSALLVSIVLSSFSIMKNHQVLKASARDIASALQRAQSLSLSSVDASEHGVHFETDKIVIFKGSVYSPTDPNNEVIAIYPPATIAYMYFSGGGSDIYFDRLTGDPNHTYGSVMIMLGGAYGYFYRYITISATGAISVMGW